LSYGHPPEVLSIRDMSPFELGTDGPQVIVVGVDGSVTSLHAAAYAAGMARRQSAQLYVVFVRSTPSMAALSPMGYASAQRALDETQADLRQRFLDGAALIGLSVEFITTEGDTFGELVKVANKVRADAVVVGTSTQAGHRVIGSIAVRLVRLGRWPVIVVP
jgi:nucleotide-binding universal stress UspA family protein